jgi:hypothetical protein
MHPLYQKADPLSHVAIGAAIEVHRLEGPGLIESIYEFGIRNRRKRRKRSMGPSIYETRETGGEKSLNLEL